MTEKLCFTEDQAFQIILKGMETGQIKLPFNGTCGAEEMLKSAKQSHGEVSDLYSISQKLCQSARLDALYLLVLRRSLTNGITDQDLKQLDYDFSRCRI